MTTKQRCVWFERYEGCLEHAQRLQALAQTYRMQCSWVAAEASEHQSKLAYGTAALAAKNAGVTFQVRKFAEC